MTIIEWRELVDAGLIQLDKDGNEIKEQQYNISMMKVNVIGYNEVGLDYKLCEEIYENGSGKDIEGRFLDVEFLQIILESTIEWVEESSECGWWKDKCVIMLNSLKKFDDDVLVQFQELLYNIVMMNWKLFDKIYKEVSEGGCSKNEMIVKYGEEVINDYEKFGDINDVFEGDWEQELQYNISMMNYKSVCEKYGDEVGLKVLDFIEEGWGENGADEFKFDDGSVFKEVVEEFIKEL